MPTPPPPTRPGISARGLWRRPATLTLLLSLPLAVAHAQVAAPPVVDNLAAPPGTAFAAPGALGATEVIGRGPTPLLLIPGAPLGLEVWRHFAQRNATRYTSYLVTLPGYDGTLAPPRTDSGARPWSDGVVRALQQLVEGRGLRRPVFVANHLMAAYYAVRTSAALGCRSGGVIALASDPVGGDPFSFVGGLSTSRRAQLLAERWRPFFRSVTRPQWEAGTYRASLLSRDSTRGERIRRAALDTPLWIQLQYYLEYLSDDVSALVRDSRVPILAVNPRFSVTDLSPPLAQALERAYGSRTAAEDSLTSQGFWPVRFGLTGPQVERHQLTTSTLVMMDDFPDEVDQIVASFVARHGSARDACR